MKATKHCGGNVLIIEDFLGDADLKTLENFVRNFNYDELEGHQFAFWHKRYLTSAELSKNQNHQILWDSIKGSRDALMDSVKDALNTYDKVAEWVLGSETMIKMYPNSNEHNVQFYDNDKFEMFVHVDNQSHMESPIFWGAVYYINDDYTGGEIYYPDYDFSYKPKANSLVLHEGNTRHGVKKVIQGDRFCVTSLITIDNVWNENPLPMASHRPEDPYFYPPGYWGKRMPDDPIQGDIKIERSNGTTAEYNPNPEHARGDKLRMNDLEIDFNDVELAIKENRIHIWKNKFTEAPIWKDWLRVYSIYANRDMERFPTADDVLNSINPENLDALNHLKDNPFLSQKLKCRYWNRFTVQLCDHDDPLENYFKELVPISDYIRGHYGSEIFTNTFAFMTLVNNRGIIGAVHTDPIDQFQWQCYGETIWRTGDNLENEYMIGAGDFIFIPKGLRHEIETTFSPRAAINFAIRN